MPHRCLQRLLRRDNRAMISLAIIVLFVFNPLCGPLIYQHIGGTYQSALNGRIGPAQYHNPFWQELTNQDQLPSSMYWLGTDAIGRDILARLMQGMLVSLADVIMVEIIDIGLGVLVGVLEGVFGGWTEQLLA